MHAGLGAKRAALDQRALAVFDRMLDENGVGRFQCTPARSLKPNLSAPCAPFLTPVSFT
jgi:hypothetical protein